MDAIKMLDAAIEMDRAMAAQAAFERDPVRRKLLIDELAFEVVAWPVSAAESTMWARLEGSGTTYVIVGSVTADGTGVRLPSGVKGAQRALSVKKAMDALVRDALRIGMFRPRERN